MRTLHTQATWKVGRQLGGTVCVFPDTTEPDGGCNGGMQIAACYGPDAEDNARLIAAGPALVRALADVTACYWAMRMAAGEPLPSRLIDDALELLASLTVPGGEAQG